MAKPLMMRKRAKIIALVLFLIGLAIVTFFGGWWPGLLLVVGIPLALWQYLQGRHYDMWVSIFVFVGGFISVQFDIRWEILLPVLFTIGGIYIFFREWVESSETPKEEEEEEEKKEIVEEDEDLKDD